MNYERVILGIDPGTNIMGYGAIMLNGDKIVAHELGIIKLGGVKDVYLKLKEIYLKTTNILNRYMPDELAIESPFFGKNVQSMLKLGRAQGVAISAALQKDVPIYEYAPRKIKMSITGNGAASKAQVAAMLGSILKCDIDAESDDATDGLAAAVCHYFQKTSLTSKRYSGWGDFVNKNKGKLNS